MRYGVAPKRVADFLHFITQILRLPVGVRRKTTQPRTQRFDDAGRDDVAQRFGVRQRRIMQLQRCGLGCGKILGINGEVQPDTEDDGDTISALVVVVISDRKSVV